LRSRLDLWFFELGYQGHLGDRFILGVGLGMIGTFDASTSVVAQGDAPRNAALSQVSRRVDDSFERYGYAPTLSLRAGFDFL
jgi:glycyl-tRNA synthetase alpha subunit